MRILFILVVILISSTSYSQNDRLNDFNNTNWLQVTGTINIDKKWSVHAEYQWRRENGFKFWQQSLSRAAVNYKINDVLSVHAGYAWAETYKYGDFPIASAGTFPEHRIYEQLSIRQPVSKLLFSHRFRVEQRWVGRVATPRVNDREIESWLFSHRFRYQLRLQYPFLPLRQRYFYGAVADEIFIAAGKNVGVNTFDQNRLFFLGGLRLNKILSIEGGYFNQTLTQGRRVSNAVIIQRNNGFLVSTILTF